MKPRRIASIVLLLFVSLGMAIPEDELVARVTGNIICPCGTNCANLLVRNCDCGVAVELSREVRKLVAEGKTEQEVYAFYEKKYGPAILAAPKLRGFNILAWVTPFVALVFGLAVVLVVVKKLKPQTEPSPPSTAAVEIDEKYRRMLEKEIKEE